MIRQTIDGSLYLEDNNSKFGTLILLQNPRVNLLENCLPLQIGRSILHFTLIKPWNFFACFRLIIINFSSNQKNEEQDYQEINSNFFIFVENIQVKVQDDFSIYEKNSINEDDNMVIPSRF